MKALLRHCGGWVERCTQTLKFSEFRYVCNSYFRSSLEPRKWHRKKCQSGRKKETAFLNKEIKEGFIEEQAGNKVYEGLLEDS